MAQPAADPAATARKALDLLLAGQYTQLTPLFTPEMQKAYPGPELAKLRQGFGTLKTVDSPTVQKSGAISIVVFPVQFEARNINFRFLVNPAGLISGMFPLSGDVPWQRPAYSKPDSFHERDVTIGDDEWKLPGTLTIPNGNGPFPAAVLVHDTGPNDRDESIGPNKIFRDLAEGLASRGIAVLRYEKRSRQYAAKLSGIRDYTVEEEVVEDAARAVALLRTQKEIDPAKIYVLAHGFGGYVAPRIAEEAGQIAGIVMLSANARPLEDLIVDQAEYLGLPAKDIEGIKAQAKRIKTLEQADAASPPLLGMSATYLLDLKSYDPIASAKKVPVKMLFLQAGRDFQVTPKELDLWKAALAGRKDAAFQTFPALNHLFVAGEGKSTQAEYRKPGHVAPEVIDTIAKWILG